MKKKILYLASGIVVLFIGFNWEIILYGIQQGVGQAKILLNTQPVEEVMKDPSFPDSLKKKIKLVQEIRQFAIDSLDLKRTKNYTTVYDQKGQPLLWVLSVAEPYQLKAYEWDYPLLGKLAYKGFFDKKKAVKEKAKFDSEGYDTELDVVNAWSTLGWLRDPILTNMLKKPPGELARLIIHELTHSTLFIKGNTEMNENIATFIGDQGAQRFMKYQFGADSKEYQQYIRKMHDIRTFSDHILRGANQLEVLYASYTSSTPAYVKDSLKQEQIREIIDTADTLNLFNPNSINLLSSNELPNNNVFLTFKIYRQYQPIFYDDFHHTFNGNLKTYLNHLKEKYPAIN